MTNFTFKKLLWHNLQYLSANHPEGIIKGIRPVVLVNLENKRFDPSGKSTEEMQEYIQRVISNYLEWYQFVNLLVEERDHDVWVTLLNHLHEWAVVFLRKYDAIIDGDYFDQLRQDLVQETAKTILKSRFPFDVSFMPWARRIMINVGKVMMRVFYRHLSQRDDGQETELIPDPHTIDEYVALTELQVTLRGAMFTLSARQREIIERRYFQDQSFETIAKELKMTLNAVYQRHYHAIRNLANSMTSQNIEYVPLG
ncbi:MAG: sigma-70 family RNA polymerase sigma factor [Ardenticatenaceae bacterium]|nr:sigma-70 family RNA polymerase sigma factor [Ardenticatenaceae bacterium]